MKWIGTYFFGYVLLLAGALAALWKLGVLASLDPTWVAIAVVILTGIGLMFAVSHSGTKENIEIDRK